MLRKAVYAGTWYPSSKKEIEKFVVAGRKQAAAKAVMVPHAGWIYSGMVAGEVFSAIKPASLYVLIGPNHHGIGAPVGVFPEGSWETPLGQLEVDAKAASALIRKCSAASADVISHSQEHSLEVQAPFIKYFSPSASILPVSLADYGIDTLRSLGEAVAAVISESGKKDALVVASSDMSHYISAAQAEKLDMLAIKNILALDPDALMKTVRARGITMCGSGPAAAALWAAKAMGASRAELVRYTNSGEVTGDSAEVVAYAGVVID